MTIYEDVRQLPQAQNIITIGPAILNDAATHEAIRFGVTANGEEAIADGLETVLSSPDPLFLDCRPERGHNYPRP